MSIGFEFKDQPNGGSLSWDQFMALHTLVTANGDPNWTVVNRDAQNGELEVSNAAGQHYIIDAVGIVTPARWWTHGTKVPEELERGVNWWLRSDPAHSEDVVMVAEDGQDALILSGFNSPDKVAWVNYQGTVQVMQGRWSQVYQEEEQ